MSIMFDVQSALRTIRTSKLRTGITIGIIALGIMALVGILTAIEGLKASIYSSFSGMGANTFQITNELLIQKNGKAGINISSSEQKNISFREALAFCDRYRFPATVGISAVARSAATVQYNSIATNPNISVLGVDENYLSITNTSLAAGRNFSPAEIVRGDYVCILGDAIARKLFRNKVQHAINAVVMVGYIRYRVIGICASKGSSMISNADNFVFTSLQNARSLYGDERSYVINVAAEEAEGLFRQIRGLSLDAPANFSVNKNDSLAAMVVENISYVTGAAMFIGFITLLGAAIGLMNIMLVSVAERTREIGISKALGAKSAVIRKQFLMESVLISLSGGIIGVILGILIGNVLSVFLKTGFIVPWTWMGLGLLLCTIVGITAGYYPAAKASRLNPIIALRYE